MNRLEHLLIILAEECAEVQQATTKMLRFGKEEGHVAVAKEYGNNLDRLRYEFNDLLSVIEMIGAEGLNLSRDPQSIKLKKEKVEKYLLYSVDCGTLDEESMYETT